VLLLSDINDLYPYNAYLHSYSGIVAKMCTNYRVPYLTSRKLVFSILFIII